MRGFLHLIFMESQKGRNQMRVRATSRRQGLAVENQYASKQNDKNLTDVHRSF